MPIEGQGAADQRVQDDTQAPDVHLWPVILLALEQFWGGVRGAPTEGVQLGAQRELIAEAEVGDFDVGLSIQQQVLSLREKEKPEGEDRGKTVYQLELQACTITPWLCKAHGLVHPRLVLLRVNYV